MGHRAAGALLGCGILLAFAAPLESQETSFLRGDVNQDGAFDLSDPVAVLLHLFTGSFEAPCLKAADLDDSGRIDINDPVYGLRYLFSAGAPPPSPFGHCGADPTPDPLTCAATPCGDLPPAIELAVDCAPAGFTELGWQVTNLETRAVAVDWSIAGSAQAGTLVLPSSGSSPLVTARAPGVNELVISHQGSELARLEQADVLISEIMASNADTVADEDGSSPDWIEINAADGPCGGGVDLTGCTLTDDPGWPTQWRFPATRLQPGDFLLVFASGKDRSTSGSELHTNFRLASAGEYLGLIAPDGVTVIDEIAPSYPEQLTDISYGLAQRSQRLVAAGDEALYHVPAAADAGLGESWTALGSSTAGWSRGATGLGFSGVATEGFSVTTIQATSAVDSLARARQVVADPGQQARVVSATDSTIDYFNSGGSGNYAGDHPFPGLGAADADDFVVVATGTVLLPIAGRWSFGVNSDDGFSLDLSNGGQTFHMEHPTPRGPTDTIEVFDVPRAGPWELTLLYFEHGGGAELELFAARGSHPTFNFDAFRLVGDTASGGIGLLGFSSAIETDIGAQMRGANASLWVRLGFDVPDPTAFGALRLDVRYEDGFVAWLNGVEVARRGAPASLRWDSAATGDRPPEDAPVVESINLTRHLDLLRAGANVLAIQGLNDAASDGDFLIEPELVASSRFSERQYMATPTPGTFNEEGAVDFVRSVESGVDHGFFDAPFDLALSTPTAGAQIRYTLDGSTPSATHGDIYASPIRISRTSVVRAAGFKAGLLDSSVTTRSYIFPADVARQSPRGEPPGPGWPTGSVNGQVLDYGMDPDVVDDPRWSGRMREALLAIPSISLVTDLDNLFGPTRGIYVHARNDGRAWERRTSAELIHPDRTPGFAVDAGLRIRGAFSRTGGNPKHSFRLLFRSEYGTGKLDYPLFGGEGADTFDKIDLRTSQNYSWAFQGSNQNTMLRDVFSRDAQRDMRQPYARSRYYHLYLNGHYWGLYQTEERADADYAETYFGGRAADYDAIKNDSSGSRALQATDGTMAAYRRLYDAAVAGFSSDLAYARVRGLLPDGTPDPAGERLLDPENVMDYMICTYYTGDPDAPVSAWAHFSNNIFAIYDRVNPGGFQWFRHDAEHSLGANGGLNEARILTDPTDRSIGQEWRHFNPAWLHLRLTENPEYLRAFADRVSHTFGPGGVFSPERDTARWVSRAAEIEAAIIAESARWGDAKRGSPLTRDDWQRQVDYMVGTYFPQRTQIVIEQMRSVGMFPALAMVSFNQPGGEVSPGFQLRMSQWSGTTGTIYYTLDGNDPRLPGGGIHPSAAEFQDDTRTVTLVSRGSTWRYKDDGSDQGTAWRDPGFSDAAWAQGPAQLGYGDGDEATVVSFGPDSRAKFPTTYFRHAFDVTGAASIISLALEIVRDDGAAVYLNGVEAIPRIHLPSGAFDFQTLASGPGTPVGGADESTFFKFSVDPGLLVEGRNVLAVEIHQQSGTSSDISFDLALSGRVAGAASAPIVLNETTTVRARVRAAGGEWGAMSHARFTIGLEGLVINEFMASNHTFLEDPDEPGEHPDWIELYNSTAAAIDLGGMYLSDDPLDLGQWRVPDGITIGPGQFAIFLADDDGTQGPFHTNYQLSGSGETISLVDRDGETVIDSIEFERQVADVSFGRYPDGAGAWGFASVPTPLGPNRPPAP